MADGKDLAGFQDDLKITVSQKVELVPCQKSMSNLLRKEYSGY